MAQANDSPRAAGSGASSAVESRLTAPAGFTVETFAKIEHARWLALGPDGAVYVSRPSVGDIVRLEDRDGNGIAERQTVAVEGLNRPHGMAFHKGFLYVANTDGVVRVRLDSSGKAAGAPVYVNHYSGGGGHWTRTIVFGPDSAMYVSIGSTCNLCIEQTPDRASVMRFDEDGSHGRVFSSGLRNAVGFAVNPTTRELWVSQNERDNIPPEHENLPPEEINILRDGADYGWPYCYTDPKTKQAVPNPEYHDAGRCARTVPAALPMQAHSAPLGLEFLAKATAFPADYRGDALVAFHGSWNRTEPTGAKVVRVHIADGKPVSYDDFITGWQSVNGERWGRPVAILVSKDGSVLISDDMAGAIYRVHR
jgi:glucose/arabinose dehydrogenase